MDGILQGNTVREIGKAFITPLTVATICFFSPQPCNHRVFAREAAHSDQGEYSKSVGIVIYRDYHGKYLLHSISQVRYREIAETGLKPCRSPCLASEFCKCRICITYLSTRLAWPGLGLSLSHPPPPRKGVCLSARTRDNVLLHQHGNKRNHEGKDRYLDTCS